MKKSSWKNSRTMWKNSLTLGLAILTVIEMVQGLLSLDFNANFHWLIKLLYVPTLYIVIVLFVFALKSFAVKGGVTVKIRGIKVTVKQGDLFEAEGWKVIAFNEYFDTTVDDIIIAKNSVNGKFIEHHVDDLDGLKQALATDNRSPFKAKRTEDDRLQYKLGCIKTYQDYMLLAFTHFNEQNEAHLSQMEYEECLRVMWSEICRAYANKPIYLPLLGSRITRFDGTPQKSKLDLLRCMLCTLRTSDKNINQPITILLTKEAMEEINIYETKGMN